LAGLWTSWLLQHASSAPERCAWLCIITDRRRWETQQVVLVLLGQGYRQHQNSCFKVLRIVVHATGNAMCGLYPVLQLGFARCVCRSSSLCSYQHEVAIDYVSSVSDLCCLQERREASGSAGCCSKPRCSQFSLRSCVPGSKAAATADVEAGCTTATSAAAGGHDTDAFTAAADQAAKGRSKDAAVSATANSTAVDPLAAPAVSPMMLPGATCKCGSTASSVDGSVGMCDCCCEGVPPAQPLEIPPQVSQGGCSCSDPGAPGSCPTATVHASAGLASHPCRGDSCLITWLISHVLLYACLQENQQLAAMIASDPHAAVFCASLLPVADGRAISMCACRSTSSWRL
jgi:hypothetical protein